MKTLQNILFLVALWMAGIYAVGLDPFACGMPLIILSAALIVGQFYRSRYTFTFWHWLIAAVITYFVIIMASSPCKDFGRSDGLLLAGCALSAWWVASASQKSLRFTLLIGLGSLVMANVVVALLQCKYVDYFPFYLKRSTITYPSGLYLHYNHFANFLLAAGLFGLGMALAGSVRLWMRIAYGVIFLLAAVGIILSNSRGALLGLGCGIVVVSLGFLGDLLRRKHSWAKVALVTCVFMAPIAVIGAWSVGSKMLAHRNNGDSGRLEFASIALDLIGENPMLGGGSRSFYDNHVKKWNPDELWVGAGDIQYVHNEYLQAAVDYGLIGAGLLLVLFCIAFFRATASLAVMGTKDHSEGEILGSIGALTGMGVQAFFSFVYHVLPDVMLLGCFLSLLLMRGQRQEDVDSSSLIAKRVFLGGAAIAVLLLALPDARAWWILKPGIASDDNPQQKAEKFAQALQIRPDFRLYANAAKHLLKMNEADLDAERKRVRATKAHEYQQIAIARAPNNLLEKLNLALIYDALDRYDEAEAIYKSIVDPLAPREYYYGTRYHYAAHLMNRGSKLWKARKPEMALFYFTQSKAELDKIKDYYIEGDVNQMRKDLESSITFLRTAKIKLPGEP